MPGQLKLTCLDATHLPGHLSKPPLLQHPTPQPVDCSAFPTVLPESLLMLCPHEAFHAISLLFPARKAVPQHLVILPPLTVAFVDRILVAEGCNCLLLGDVHVGVPT